MRWGWRGFWFAAGLAAGVLVPAWLLLEDAVVARFAARRIDQPSRVYARPLELFPGKPVTAAALRRELEFADYREAAVSQPGRFQLSQTELRVHTRPFHFIDGAQAARQLQISLSQERIERIHDLRSGTDLPLARIDPAEIASIYPLSGEDRINTALAAFPPLLVTTAQAVEDRQFKHHPGVDVRGLMRAMWVNLRAGGLRQGGSTITQQLVKNLYLSSERSLWRKFNESLMALALERHFDKGVILEAYLNEVYLGQDGAHAIHGFARAADYYFGVPAASLNPAQIALLVGMVKGPSWYNPRRHPQRALARRNQVLEIMRETGLIGSQALQRALAQPLGVQPAAAASRQRRYPAFLDLVRRQLRRDYRDRDLSQAGLRILTTLDPLAQQAAERALSDRLSASGMTELQGAVVLVAPQSGDVAALVGDRQPRRWGYNRALDASRQIGSIMKPLVYLLALEMPSRFTLSTAVSDAPVSVALEDGKRWQPTNYDGVSHGQVPLLQALVASYNQATVRIGQEVGVTRVLELLRRLGVQNDMTPHPSVLLGALELTPLQVAQAYQVLAADGYYSALSSVHGVLDAGGRPLSRYPTRKRAIAERNGVALVNYALSRTSVEGTARNLPGQLRQPLRLAAKTGTTNDRRDAWFVGYTAEWLGVVWVGRDDHRPAGITGAASAMPVWSALFNQIQSSDLQYTTPDDVAWYWIDWPADELADERCDGARPVPYIKGSEPEEWSKCIGSLRSFFRNL
ncbi:MAG: penicillin-binding protein 1B [Wenzhouxiangellaceae bacterium]